MSKMGDFSHRPTDITDIKNLNHVNKCNLCTHSKLQTRSSQSLELHLRSVKSTCHKKKAFGVSLNYPLIDSFSPPPVKTVDPEFTHLWSSQTRCPIIGTHLTKRTADDNHRNKDGWRANFTLFNQCNSLAADVETTGSRANTPPVSALLLKSILLMEQAAFSLCLSGWMDVPAIPSRKMTVLVFPPPHGSVSTRKNRQSDGQTKMCEILAGHRVSWTGFLHQNDKKSNQHGRATFLRKVREWKGCGRLKKKKNRVERRVMELQEEERRPRRADGEVAAVGALEIAWLITAAARPCVVMAAWRSGSSEQGADGWRVKDGNVGFFF